MRLKFRVFHDFAQFAKVHSQNPYSQKYIIHNIVPLFKCLGSIMALLKYFLVSLSLSLALTGPCQALRNHSQ